MQHLPLPLLDPAPHRAGTDPALHGLRGRQHPGLVVVGFAAETGDAAGGVMDHARAKLARKGCDLLVVNDVGGGKVFGAEDNEAVVLSAGGEAVTVPLGSKSALAHVVWDQVLGLLARRP